MIVFHGLNARLAPCLLVIAAAAISACSKAKTESHRKPGADSEQNSQSSALNSPDQTALREKMEPSLSTHEAGLTTLNKVVGRVLVEQWHGVPGNHVSDFTVIPDFPLRPSSRFFINALEIPHNSADNFGTRIRGYIHPVETGAHVFYISGDNESQLFLSTSDSPVQLSKAPIAQLTAAEWTAPNQWEKFVGQVSQAIPLEAGKKYYFEVLHKEGLGSDGVAVGWKLPGGVIQRPIAGANLSAFESHPGFESKEPLESDILNSLTRSHPRLIASQLDFSRVKQLGAVDSKVKSFVDSLLGTPPAAVPVFDLNNRKKCDSENGHKNPGAELLLHIPPCTRIKQDEIRILDTSREVLRRVHRLSIAYHLTGDLRFAERAIAEMKAVSDPAWGDWNPSHFLDTAEMTHALAIGYDWLHAVMSPADRLQIRNAIKSKGLTPGLNEYQKLAHWTKSVSNWNVVCNGGLTLGALAIAEDEPQIAARILSLAVASARKSGALQVFAPDGGYPEGIGYWGYAVKYIAALLSGLESGLGTDFGLGKAAGLSEAGRFPLAAIGPRFEPFNYADVGGGAMSPSSDLHFLAQKYSRPEFSAFAAESLGGYGIFWYNPDFLKSNHQEKAQDYHFQGVQVAMFRSGMGDKDAYVGFKSGDNKAGHSHLDLGSFVFDAKGVRWAKDLGLESYGPVGQDYFHKEKRWNFYKTRAEGQNTLVINPSLLPGQDPKAAASIANFRSSADEAMATTDLTAPYKPYGANSIRRGVKLYKKSQILMVQDEISLASPSEVYWFMHTDAVAEVSGATAVLTKGDKKLLAKILSPAQATFKVLDAAALPTSPAKPKGESVNTNNRKLTVHLAQTAETQLTIVLIPLDKNEAPPSQWPAAMKLKDW